MKKKTRSMRLSKSNSANVLAMMSLGGYRHSRTFVVASKDKEAFESDMLQHGWKRILAESIPNADFFWVVMAPSMKTLAARPRPKAAPTTTAPTTTAPAPATTAPAPMGNYEYRPPNLLADEIQGDIRYKNIDTGDPNFDMSSQMATPSVTPDRPTTETPFHRPLAFQEGMPHFVRFMWDPWTGSMLLTGNDADDHSHMHANYNRKEKERGNKVTPFDGWIRGYYKPDTGQIMLRPWDWPVEGKEIDPLAERVTGSLGERIKSKLLWMLSKELKIPFDDLKSKTLYYLNEQDLQENLGKRRRY